MNKLGSKGKKLLKLLVAEIRKGRFKPGDSSTFISYSEALKKLGGLNPQLFAGTRLQRKGLNELNEWTKTAKGIPHVAGLIVNKKTQEPSIGYPASHGLSNGNTHWKKWWMSETTKAIGFNWTSYVS